MNENLWWNTARKVIGKKERNNFETWLLSNEYLSVSTGQACLEKASPDRPSEVQGKVPHLGNQQHLRNKSWSWAGLPQLQRFLERLELVSALLHFFREETGERSLHGKPISHRSSMRLERSEVEQQSTRAKQSVSS